MINGAVTGAATGGLLDDRDFPNVKSALIEEYFDLVKKLENYDKSQASYYLKFSAKVV